MPVTRSEDLFARAQRVIPGGVNSPVRAFKAVGGTPRFIARAQGARVWDADGSAYVDYLGSWGPMILGHAHPAVVEAVARAARDGTSYGAPCAAEVELAERVTRLVPSIEKVRFVSSGTEATMSALRLARGFTGRRKILKLEGCYHGHADALLVAAGSGVATLGIPGSPGVPEGTVADTVVAPYNDAAAAELAFAEHGADLAAVIVEPVAGNMGCVPPRAGYLQALRDLTRRHGAVLIFDEVITGFRWAPGGAQERYGVTPDLTTLAKIVAGGMPGGAMAGKREIMEMLAFKDEPGWNATKKVRHQGTYNASPVVAAAGTACLQKAADPNVQRYCDEIAARLRAGFNAALVERGVPGYAWGESSVFHVNLGEAAPNQGGADLRSPAGVSAEALKSSSQGAVNSVLRLGMMLEGVELFTPGGMTSTTHTVEDIDETVAAFGRVLERMAGEGGFAG